MSSQAAGARLPEIQATNLAAAAQAQSATFQEHRTSVASVGTLCRAAIGPTPDHPVGRISLHAGHVPADQFDGFIQSVPAPARDEDVSFLCNEQLGTGQRHTA
jgi:hypothetical protein